MHRHGKITAAFSVVIAGAAAAACASKSPPPAASAAQARAHAAPPPAPPARPLMRSSEIDDAIRAEWTKAGVTAAPTVDDAGFLRRAWLDLAGRVPPPEEVTSFLADTAPDKRARAVDRLLASPAYADHMTNYFDRLLLGRDARPGVVDRVAFRKWLHDRFAENTPYDQLVFQLVAAKGLNSVGGNPFKHDPDAGAAPPEDEDKVNGAVNWYVRYSDSLPDLSGTTSRLFLGVQIQCAQCHDHKTEKWKMGDFRSFEQCFTKTRARQLDKGKVMGVRRFEVEDVKTRFKPNKRMDAPDLGDAPPRAIDGTDFSSAADPREALARWITSKQNPWFAREIANRMWAQMLGRGFFEPVDDSRESNPPIMPELLQKIADDFVASGFDLKHLVRLIANTEVYQRAASPGTAGTDTDEKLWAHFQIQRLGPDELLDSLAAATGFDTLLEKSAGENIEVVRFGMRRQFAFLFDVDEESDHHDEFDGTITQALMLMNGGILNRAVGAFPKGTALAQVLATRAGGDEAKVRSLYLRSVSREPTADETKTWVEYVDAPRTFVTTPPPAMPPIAAPAGKGAGPRGPGQKAYQKIEQRLEQRAAAAPASGGGGGDPKQQAYEDLFWALLNSSEFEFNH